MPFTEQELAGLEIPAFLRFTGTAEERSKMWDEGLAKSGRTMSHTAFVEPPKAVDQSTAAYIEEAKEAARIKTANRIAKMKLRMRPKNIVDNEKMLWDGWNCCWRWLHGRHRVRWNNDGTPADPAPTTQGTNTMSTPQTATTPKGKPDTYTKRPTAAAKAAPTAKAGAKVKAKVVGADKKAKTADAAPRGVGIIAAIITACKAPGGATIAEIMAALTKQFPERKASKVTAQIQANKNATTKERVEGRGLVYYIK